MSDEELASLVQYHSGLHNVVIKKFRETLSPRFVEYSGTAVDSEGIEYDVMVDVTPQSAHWTASPRPRFLRTEQAERVAMELLGLVEVQLVQTGAGRFEGAGVDEGGNVQWIRGSIGQDLLKQWVFVVKICDDDGFEIRSEAFYEKLPIWSGKFGLQR